MNKGLCYRDFKSEEKAAQEKHGGGGLIEDLDEGLRFYIKVKSDICLGVQKRDKSNLEEDEEKIKRRCFRGRTNRS